MKPSVALTEKRDAALAVIARYSVRNPRIFGSVANGNDRDGSDLDILVDALPGTTLLDMSGLQSDLEDLLGLSVDVRTPAEISQRFRQKVLASARPM